MKILLLIFSLFFSTVLKAEKIDVSVKGMVCAFCAAGIEKGFKKEKNCEKINVNLESKVVSIKTKKKTTISDEKINKIITGAGFNVVSIKRTKNE